jgi:hypothetical protein
MNIRIPSLRGRACWLLLGLTVSCSRAPESSAPKSGGEPAAPGGALAASPEPEPEPTTLAEAEQLLARAQAELDQQLALNQSPAPAAGAPAPAAAEAPADRAQRAEKSAAADEAEAPPPPNPCETACRAFASLGRASEAVCRLDTQGGQRCERARQIRDDAARRVASCSCK